MFLHLNFTSKGREGSLAHQTLENLGGPLLDLGPSVCLHVHR